MERKRRQGGLEDRPEVGRARHGFHGPSSEVAFKQEQAGTQGTGQADIHISCSSTVSRGPALQREKHRGGVRGRRRTASCPVVVDSAPFLMLNVDPSDLSTVNSTTARPVSLRHRNPQGCRRLPHF